MTSAPASHGLASSAPGVAPESSHSRHSAVVACVPVPKASPGSSSSKTSVHVGPDGRGIRPLSAWAHPEPPSETHRLEVLEPLALPGAIGDGLELRLLGDQQWIESRRRTERGTDLVDVGVRREDGTHDDGRPERHRAGGWLEDGVVGRVEQRDGQRAEFEQRVLVRLGVARADVEAELQERHAVSLVRFAGCRQRAGCRRPTRAFP